jgi:hypothetical protein
MPIIQVRDVPEHIYRAIAEKAEQERRSLSQQVVAVLARGLELELDPKARRKSLLQKVQAGDPTSFNALSDPAKLIREDRKR